MQTFVVPDGMDMQLAACVPIAYGTAHDCLFEFGHLQKGESVLIQAAAGGVGLAAVQLAKRAGATVHRDCLERREDRTTEGSSGSTTASTTARATGSRRRAGSPAAPA